MSVVKLVTLCDQNTKRDKFIDSLIDALLLEMVFFRALGHLFAVVEIYPVEMGLVETYQIVFRIDHWGFLELVLLLFSLLQFLSLILSQFHQIDQWKYVVQSMSLPRIPNNGCTLQSRPDLQIVVQDSLTLEIIAHCGSFAFLSQCVDNVHMFGD
eukprot:NODE_75_length_23955_cov_0.435069.p16 type:complete len:155 gc:universal NODE_75_length_23955_cov_0.435069:5435-5899(+)